MALYFCCTYVSWRPQGQGYFPSYFVLIIEFTVLGPKGSLPSSQKYAVGLSQSVECAKHLHTHFFKMSF